MDVNKRILQAIALVVCYFAGILAIGYLDNMPRLVTPGACCSCVRSGK